MKKILLNLEENILIALSLIMIWGSLIYYFYSLNWLGLILTITLSGLSFYLKNRFLSNNEQESEEIKSPLVKSWFYTLWPLVIYLILAAGAFLILFNNSSSSALISPWSQVPVGFFWFYLGATVCLFYILHRQIKQTLKLWLLRLHYFLAFSVAIIIYQIGYGFDPFIHQATMELIAKQGYVDPKPLYYLGQYSLIVLFHKLSGLSIYFLNKILIPLVAALFLPKAIFSFLEKRGTPKRAALTILVLLALPLNLFILSTPQNLNYLWLLLLIFYSLSSHLNYTPLILSLATLSIHPLGGLPALLFVGWIELKKIKSKIKKSWYKVATYFLWLISALSLPLAFTVVTGESWKNISFDLSEIAKIFKLTIRSSNSSDFVLNFFYALSNNYLVIFILVAICGFIIWFKNNRAESYLLLKMLSALFIGFLLSISLSFNFLIDYERSNYVSRLPILMGLFALPAIILALDYLITRVWRSPKIQIVSGIIIAALLITASMYLSYPRLDAYTNSRGYSVSSADISAVLSIDKQSKQPYIVLANQQTSVAALKELGFNHYFKTAPGPTFFYPIPTGGALYQYYLDMVNKNPERKTMEKAMALVGVKESYFVVSKYWWLSGRIISEAKLQADSYWEIANGEIYIFKFNN